MSVKRITIVLLALAVVVGFIALGVKDAVKTKDNLEFQKVQLNSKQAEIKQLNVKYDQLNQNIDKASEQKTVNQDEMTKLEQQKQQLEQQKQELEKQLQSRVDEGNKLASTATTVADTVTGTGTAVAAEAPGGGIDCDNQTTAKAFIYCHESGNTADKWNGIGCFGLGQDCNKIVFYRCGVNYACQDKFFTDYMQRRYGTWEKAKAFWLARVPINGKDKGNWW